MRIITSFEGKMHDAVITTEKLLPCPFCGSANITLNHTWTAAYWIHCEECRAERPGYCADNSDPYDANEHLKNARSAVELWNVRV